MHKLRVDHRGGTNFMTRIRTLFSLDVATLGNHIILLYNKPVTIHYYYYYYYSEIICCGFY